MSTEDRMTGGELQTIREHLGLSGDALAAMLSVAPRTLRSWESGRDPIPHRVREEVEQIEADTARAVGELVAALQDARDPAVVVYRTDADLHAARPDTAHLSARWWRHVVARACQEVPGVVIGTRADLEHVPGTEAGWCVACGMWRTDLTRDGDVWWCPVHKVTQVLVHPPTQ